MKTIPISILLLAMACLGQRPDEAKVHRLPEALAARTHSLNPEYGVHGEPGADHEGQLPLLIYLHGAGGIGSDIDKSIRQIRPLRDTLRKASIETLIVAPQATRSPRREGAKGGWLVEDLDILLGHLLESLPVDPDRVYLTGNSMGGYGSFMWAGTRPGHFAAVAPMVGGLGALGPKDVTGELPLWGRNLAGLPLRAYYGGKDGVVPPDRGRMILDAIEKGGGKQAEVIVLDEEGHGAGRVPYGQPDFFEWLFSHTRKAK